MTELSDFRRVAAADRFLCIVATTRGDGSVQASLVNAGVMANPRGGDDVVAFVAAGGTHDDWDAYDAAMASERRVVVLVNAERVYSNG